MKTLNYNQTLEIVENFMIKTGIRDFCSNICKGNCCMRCYQSKNACHKHEGRRLSCSAFVCQIPSIEREELHACMIKSRIAINNIIMNINKKHNKLKMEPHIVYTGDVYFQVQSPLLFTEFKINANIINKCFVGLIDVTKRAVESVTQVWEKEKDNPDKYNVGWTSSKFTNFVVIDGKVEHYHIFYNRQAYENGIRGEKKRTRNRDGKQITKEETTCS